MAWVRSDATFDEHEVSIQQEVAAVFMGRPHVVLLGAGASKAALPHGDKHGTEVPLLRDVAKTLDLAGEFPEDLRSLAIDDFEAAYSRLFDRDASLTAKIDARVRDFFSKLVLPDAPNLYDVLNLSLRRKDAIFTFNWDPFLLQSRVRLAKLGVGSSLPQLYFLHGNVLAGFCRRDRTSGLVGARCRDCGQRFEPSPLLFPVEKKNYQDGGLVEREWESVRAFLRACFMLTIFGYSAPTTDVEAIDLLKQGWGTPAERNMEQTEIINRPDADENELRQKWRDFIHTHHYDVHGSFRNSWLGNHPRRSGEAYWHQYWEAKFVTNNPIPNAFASPRDLVEWFGPLFEAERREQRNAQPHADTSRP